jgi:RNA 2',3'-cyclic 3'-phosphodiesterase
MTARANVDGGERLRLFLALQLPGEFLDAVTAWQPQALDGPRLRALPREHLHVTLAFLGNRPADELPAILGALRGAVGEARRPVLRVTGYRETRSVGMLVLDDEGAHATRLAGDLHERLEALGVYRREERQWLPHLTVVRFREHPRLRPELVPALGEPFSPSEAAAYLSRLHPSGARYEVLDSVALGG